MSYIYIWYIFQAGDLQGLVGVTLMSPSPTISSFILQVKKQIVSAYILQNVLPLFHECVGEEQTFEQMIFKFSDSLQTALRTNGLKWFSLMP